MKHRNYSGWSKFASEVRYWCNRRETSEIAAKAGNCLLWSTRFKVQSLCIQALHGAQTQDDHVKKIPKSIYKRDLSVHYITPSKDSGVRDGD